MNLGSVFRRDGRYEMDVERHIAAGNRVNGFLAVRCIDETAKRQHSCAKCSVGTDLLYGSETWVFFLIF